MKMRHQIRGGAVAAMLFAASVPAAVEERYSVGTSGNILWQDTRYVNLTITSPPGTDHLLYNILPSPQYNRSYQYSLFLPSGTACFEIETKPHNYSTAPNDTRIWLLDYTTGQYRSLDNNSGQGGMYSKARAFLRDYSALDLYFSQTSLSYAGQKFEYTIKQLNLGESACTTDQSLPWIKRTGFNSTYSSNVN